MITWIAGLSEMANTISEKFTKEDLENMEIVFKVETPEKLKKINEDFFYRYNSNGTLNDDVESVVVNVNGIHFRYELINEDN